MVLDKAFIQSVRNDEKFCSAFEKIPVMAQGRFKLIDKVIKDIDAEYAKPEYGEREMPKVLKKKAKEIYEKEITYGKR